ncbi:response regulator [Catenovulum maritimum]|uniref:Response regulatory domain-containing protein n=1 Tax=Catenovulum maritimum TaxID=1513271 RepID=A0A0J8GYT5_9ALTE|nr:response regulator [Catenovulum maritimum]KMT66404.1 hypothetical protein XM47_04055 [Catenovulum maritimum]
MFSLIYLDDELSYCEMFEEYFASDNLEIFTFSSANKAIKFCNDSERKIDLAFLDYRLADTTGVEVAKAISSDIPKILVTGELTKPNSDEFIYFISKPFKFSEIEEILLKCNLSL